MAPEEEIKKKKEKKYHNKLAEAIENMQFGRSLASLTKLFKSRALFWNICFVIR